MIVTLAQLAPLPRDVEANLERACALVDSSGGSDLVVLPELFLSGYELEDPAGYAVELRGDEMCRLGRVARAAGTAVIVGVAERAEGGTANTAACLDASGRLVDAYRKTHPFGAERDAYVEGRELVTVGLAGRAVGLMICFDMEFPEVARTLAGQGADMLVTISANGPPFGPDHAVFARARALENGLPHVYVNRAGEQDGLDFCGESVVVDPEGRTIAECGSGAEATLDVELGPPGRADPRTRYREQLRAELYR